MNATAPTTYEYTIAPEDVEFKSEQVIHIGDLVEISIQDEATFSEYDFIGFIDDFDEDEGKIYLETFGYGKSSKENRSRVHFGYSDSFRIHWIDTIKILKKTEKIDSKQFNIIEKSVHYDYNHYDFPKVKNKVFHWVVAK